jgi:hypothetical protein
VGGSIENQNAYRNADSKGCAHEVSVGNKDSVGNWTRGHECSILAKNLSTFCPRSEALWEAELINLVEEIKETQHSGCGMSFAGYFLLEVW